ncbi:MAG TPA: DNA-processing protein DprA, partial [Steroidobacteraceae bacterium]|nr:DNA-processing protein DprA [Steroidobacteraceae bacterium]
MDTPTEPTEPPEPWLIALRAPALPARLLRAALAATGSIGAVLASSRNELLQLGLAPETIEALRHPSSAFLEQDLHWLRRSGVSLLPITARDYPSQLADLPDPPPALFLKGRRELLQAPQLAVVGSRHPTAAGRRIAQTLAQQIGQAGVCITSGLARGIDTAAHEGALQGSGGTIAVCGTGLDRCYPADNAVLFERIAENGLLVSEFPPGTEPRRSNFPRRNRIISGLARGTLVVEAASGSGSLITAQRALEQGREVFAVPGSPLNPLAAGCLDLLRQGAHLVRHAGDVLEHIQISIESNSPCNQELALTGGSGSGLRRLDKDYEMLLDALGFEPASIDDLVDRTGLSPGSVASMMLILELEG